jgi:hypothetical protein
MLWLIMISGLGLTLIPVQGEGNRLHRGRVLMKVSGIGCLFFGRQLSE